MKSLFDEVSFKTSRFVTHQYSTSFSIGVRCFSPPIRNAIYSIYGFVRLADEIVDTFHEYDKEYLLDDFEKSYYMAVKHGISMNPILNSFQFTVRKYNIDEELVRAFLNSMRSDLRKKKFDENEIKEYIYGSAEVVGLMCLKVFVNGNQASYNELQPYAMRLGAAFQKINFLRDLQHDTQELSRTYFPVLKNQSFDEKNKRIILDDIYSDYEQAMIGIRKLPEEARFGVYTAYLYYRNLTKIIEKTDATQIMKKRISVPNSKKLFLLFKAYLANKVN